MSDADIYLAYRPVSHERALSPAHVVSRLRSPKTICGREVGDDWEIVAASRLPIGVCPECRRRRDARD